ncbi:MAG: NAD(P)H-dependent oxidoreductase [Chryseobacterium sp.]|nr:MAG: NAD(P)H-dependent oxidoreductase [Chryseobacterium sp.]
MDYLDKLKKRYSPKKFDGEMVPDEAVERILEAARLSVSSMGLQPYKIFIAKNKQSKEKLFPAFYNLSQISTCSHMLMLVAKKEVEESYVDGYLRHINAVRGTDMADLQAFRNSILGYLSQLTSQQLSAWSARQAYIALSSMIFAAALERVDSCPMEGFRQDVMDHLLGINPDEESTVVCLAIGYHADDDPFRHNKKVRKPSEKFAKYL